jgi:DNA-binding NarL/FixJ family response regulator
MNPIAEEILMHIGTATSGRYPKGSGEDPHQHSGDFLSRVDGLKKQGLGDTEIAKSLNMTTTEYRTQRSLANAERRTSERNRILQLKEKGYSLKAIATEMGYSNDSSIRSLLNENAAKRMNMAQKTADFLKQQVDEKGIIDVGRGIERELKISPEKMKQAIEILKTQGYLEYGGGIPTGPGKQTNGKFLCPPGTEHKAIYDYKNINYINDYTSHDDGATFDRFTYPKSLDSSRIKIRYAEEGGIHKDGVVEIRRGVDDLSLGNSHYAQVRIMVDDKKYIKGMAVYSDNLPDGVDVLFNTNKKSGTPMGDVLKNIKDDPDNPFGSLIKAGGQNYYTDKDGNKQLGLVNKAREEGDWQEWSNSLPAQFLSKQNMHLINKQLNLAITDKQAEFDEINSLNNPTIKKALLRSFSDDCDAAAVHLQAAALPRQKYHVILPVPSLKDNEVYAPNYNNGEKIALIRYPHGGTFEIPILTVNNKHADSKRVLGNSPSDAVGINSKIAERLSGADFDGDTVMTIPVNDRVKIKSTPSLRGLEGFNAKDKYGPGSYDESTVTLMKHISKKGKEVDNTQLEMGKISNLITDMTLKGANNDELARAVKHSMVVIDAAKHKLNYKKSEEDNGIAALKKYYQGSVDINGRYHEGSATLISKSKSETPVLKRRGSPKINQVGKDWYDPNLPEGTLLWTSVRQEFIGKDGKIQIRTQKSTKMAEAKDAMDLSSGTPQEEAYANFANKMKALANQSRKEMVYTGKIAYSSGAKEVYKEEVKSLEAQLRIAELNAPKERKAQILANAVVKAKKQENPDMTSSEIKKVKQQHLTAARLAIGAKKTQIKVTDKEWEAIQAGAISENRLNQIINNADMDILRQRATPRATTMLSTAKLNKAAAMNASGHATSDIAKALGVSTSTISRYLNGKGETI